MQSLIHFQIVRSMTGFIWRVGSTLRSDIKMVYGWQTAESQIYYLGIKYRTPKSPKAYIEWKNYLALPCLRFGFVPLKIHLTIVIIGNIIVQTKLFTNLPFQSIWKTTKIIKRKDFDSSGRSLVSTHHSTFFECIKKWPQMLQCN